MNFYFIRHGETDWNKEKRLQGRSDIPLNDKGRSQALEAKGRFSNHKIDYIVCSPLQRAKETALIVNELLQAEIIYDDRLIERDHGIIEGMTEENINAHNEAELFDLSIPTDWNGWRFPWKAETIEALIQRADYSVTEYIKLYPQKKILFCAHGAWFRSYIYAKTGHIFHTNNADPYLCNLEKSQITRLAEIE